MSECYGRLQSLDNPPGSIVTQQYRFSQFNIGGRSRGVSWRSREYRGKGYVHGRGHDIVAKEDMVERSMIPTHIHSPEGMEYLRQSPVYTLHTNGDSSPRKKL